MTERRSSSSAHKSSSHRFVANGTYERLEEIGKGSFATVYKAAHRKHHGFCAIKSVDVHRLNKKLKENLYSEIQILKGLRHPHIVALIDCKEDSANIHLIMEYCELGDLSQFIRRKDSVNLPDALKKVVQKYPNPQHGGLHESLVRHLLKQLADAMHFLRQRNFIHRDVKPQNLLLIPPRRTSTDIKGLDSDQSQASKINVGVIDLPILKLADFGFARSLPATSLAETLCGSPLYMAPEILRYEKYDARVDLWSVGTVLFEMLVGKPPFRASNHVELLRKIEKGEDKIRFPESLHVSSIAKQLVRGLLRRKPSDRLSFEQFFASPIITSEIPGLAAGHAEVQQTQYSDSSPPMDESSAETKRDLKRASFETARSTIDDHEPIYKTALVTGTVEQKERSEGQISDSAPLKHSVETTMNVEANKNIRSATAGLVPASDVSRTPVRRSSEQRNLKLVRRQSQGTTEPNPSDALRQKANLAREVRPDARERAAQDIAFERDYVLVEKRAVEVNALADQFAHSPIMQASGKRNTAVGESSRRISHQDASAPTPSAMDLAPHATHSLASGRRHSIGLQRFGSYERRLRDPMSATSAISKAISMASGRLFGTALSPPLTLNRGGRSISTYSPFPAYPVLQSGALIKQEAGRHDLQPMNEEDQIAALLEDNATRADVVYGFAEVKYQQVVPISPGTISPRLHPDGAAPGQQKSPTDGYLTNEARLQLSEEALVLYVKTLSILARCIDIAGSWWNGKNAAISGSSLHPITISLANSHTKVEHRINNVVQWIRDQFNITLEKAEFVRLKMIEAQKQLSENEGGSSPVTDDHTVSTSPRSKGLAALSTSDPTSNVTAEKLMYDRALEMSRSAAVSELLGEDFVGCELAYTTSIRLLEAVLETNQDKEDHDRPESRARVSSEGRRPEGGDLGAVIADDDRQIVLNVIESIKTRLTVLRNKIEAVSKNVSPSQQQIGPRPATSSSVAPTASTAQLHRSLNSESAPT